MTWQENFDGIEITGAKPSTIVLEATSFASRDRNCAEEYATERAYVGNLLRKLLDVKLDGTTV
jgi:hypothetical protein